MRVSSVSGVRVTNIRMWQSPICLTTRKERGRLQGTRMLKHRMIKLLEKLLIQRDEIHRKYGTSLRHTRDYLKRLSIIRKVLAQEKEIFEGWKVNDRIVSIDRHYVRLEGSFGTQKQHYSLLRIKVRNKKTEILWIFFGIHTANAVLMIGKVKNRPDKIMQQYMKNYHKNGIWSD